jgi:hypothetical protein
MLAAMRRALILSVIVSAAVTRLHAQVAEHIPVQQAGATDWFGERVLRVRGGARIEIEPSNAGHAAVLQMLPDGTLLVRRVTAVAAGRQAFDVARPETPATPGAPVKVPFVVTSTGDRGIPPGPYTPPPPPPLTTRTGRDGILVILTDVPLDSADLTDRLGRLPALPADSVASHLGQLLVGHRTAMWAAYYQAR